MPEERIDPVYQYVDHKLDEISRELSRTRLAHEAMIAQQARAQLQTQRALAVFIVTTTHYLSSLTPGVNHDMFTQLGLSASAAIARIETSADPLPIAAEFRKAFLDALEKSGIKLNRLS
jgi:hypothetical protein